MIQLSLYPERGYSLLGSDGLVEDWTSGEPFFTRLVRSSDMRYALKALSWGCPRIVNLERHFSPADERPTYIIGKEIKS